MKLNSDDGWQIAPPLNDFTKRFGPLLQRPAGDGWIYAMRAEEGHRNEAGLMHGGAMTAFIDEFVGTEVAKRTGRPHVTVQLSTTFLQAVRMGDVVEASCEIVKTTRSMTFVEARLHVGEALVATAALIFKAAGAVVESPSGSHQ